MDQMELGRWFGRMEATLEDHGRRLLKLESRRPQEVTDWRATLPYIYGVTILALAILGKISWAEAIQGIIGSR
jgi:hypothetical protein